MKNIKFSRILLSIILFLQRILSAQLRIHKRGCPVSPPPPLVMSVVPVKTQMSGCLVLYIKETSYFALKVNKAKHFWLSASFTGHPQSLMNYICYIHLELGTDTKS